MKKEVRCQVDAKGNVIFECPGCGCLHSVSTQEPNGMGAIWDWNGDTEKPTFKPSILARANYTDEERMDDVCHSFVTDGAIRFLADCTHDLKGQNVELPLWDCDHDWKVIDDSYEDQSVIFEQCQNCDETREHEPEHFDDDVI